MGWRSSLFGVSILSKSRESLQHSACRGHLVPVQTVSIMPTGHSDPARIAGYAADITARRMVGRVRARAYLPTELEALFGHRMRAIAPALVLCGWQRVRCSPRLRSRRRATFWLPPHVARPARVRGRPVINLVTILSTQSLPGDSP
jgi:hypothetical protein